MRTEHEEQKLLFAWAQYKPELKYMYAVPNGGKRHPATARKLKMEGVKAGVPDVFLPLPKNGYHGLYLEMKRQNLGYKSRGVVSASQKEYLNHLEQMGYKCAVANGFDEAKAIIEAYLL